MPMTQQRLREIENANHHARTVKAVYGQMITIEGTKLRALDDTIYELTTHIRELERDLKRVLDNASDIE